MTKVAKASKSEGVKAEIQAKGFYYRNFAIIGHVDLVDIVINSDSPFAEKNCFHWILGNPVENVNRINFLFTPSICVRRQKKVLKALNLISLRN
jgi:hypothetical protein